MWNFWARILIFDSIKVNRWERFKIHPKESLLRVNVNNFSILFLLLTVEIICSAFGSASFITWPFFSKRMFSLYSIQLLIPKRQIIVDGSKPNAVGYCSKYFLWVWKWCCTWNTTKYSFFVEAHKELHIREKNCSNYLRPELWNMQKEVELK